MTPAEGAVELARARAELDRQHDHPTRRLLDAPRKDCRACRFAAMAQMVGDRSQAWHMQLLDLVDDRAALLRRVAELERALGTTIVKLGALVGTLEELV